MDHEVTLIIHLMINAYGHRVEENVYLLVADGSILWNAAFPISVYTR